MLHPWEKERPLSAWLPGGYCGQKDGKPNRNLRPVIHHEKCSRCGFCWIYCPEGCITRGETYLIDYDYCKGCGVCGAECPKDAIAMVREDQ
ncbi:MAG TPA: 4Fe-4S binding protein [Clostridia bacterium]|nr:4Fe-4S binding protein [Clostridia bacterium]